MGHRKTTKKKKKSTSRRKKTITTLPTIILTQRSPIIPGAIILTKPKSRAQKFLELQPKITPFLAGTLAGLVTGPIAAAKVFLGTGLASGILTGSKRARAFAKTKILDPTAVGIGIGGLIEDPGKLIPKEKTGAGLRERVIEVGKSAGLIGGTAAALVGGVALGKKALEKIPKVSLPSKKIAPQALPVGLLPALPSLTPTTQPLGAVKQPIEELPVVVKGPKPMKITNTFNPTIDIRFSKSKRFINQQINVRR